MLTLSLNNGWEVVPLLDFLHYFSGGEKKSEFKLRSISFQTHVLLTMYVLLNIHSIIVVFKENTKFYRCAYA